MDTEQASDYAFGLKNYRIAQGTVSWDWNRDKDCYKHPQNQYMEITHSIEEINTILESL